MRILVVDFYDSFVYNLVHYFKANHVEVDVISDAHVNPQNLSFLENYSGIVLSPGPGLPEDTVSMLAIINYCVGRRPVFGVCLGMQGLGQSLGGNLVNMKMVRHGVSSVITFEPDKLLFEGLLSPLEVGLYHSWKVDGLDEKFITSKDENGTTMSLEAKERKQLGVQFHPESILTSQGKLLISNVVNNFFRNN